ncbi:MAG TPA: efflux RND transporter periplasmic adaptor subunit [Gemmatimonadaceae bacterium]|nr:efflux RND transporter periplasmic adaptor subunit [Gemmatimonadaceae bacterium]
MLVRKSLPDTVVTMLVVLVWTAGCGGKAAPPGGPPPPPEVAVVTIAPRTIAESHDIEGQIEPSRRVDVRARVEGIIVERPFTEGSDVAPGQVLFRLERVRYEAAYEAALSRYDNARRTLDRLQPLLAQHAVAQQDVDNARSAADAAKGALDQSRKDLDDTTIRAEIAGRVGRTRLELGGRVTGPADLLTTVERLDPVYVTFRPSTQQLQLWRQDPRSRALLEARSPLQVRLVLSDGSMFPRPGRLNFVAPSLDSATGTQEFRAEFPNRDHVLVPGQFVRVRLEGFSRADAIAVPQRAVQQGLGRQYVYVVGAGDTAMVRDVKPGPWSGNLWIIDAGLKPGDRVIVDGLQKIAQGRPVRPVPAPDSSATPGASAAATGAGAARGGARP